MIARILTDLDLMRRNVGVVILGAGVIGALVAGMLVARTDVAEPVSRGTAPLAAILVPVFFVTVPYTGPIAM